VRLSAGLAKEDVRLATTPSKSEFPIEEEARAAAVIP
jgi:hypothetical protein